MKVAPCGTSKRMSYPRRISIGVPLCFHTAELCTNSSARPQVATADPTGIVYLLTAPFCERKHRRHILGSWMTYCVGMKTQQGLVLASDSRSNARYAQVNTCRKMFTFVTPGERAFALLTSGSLSLSQSIIT